MLTDIRVRGYRSCRDSYFRCHPNLSVLIGPNGSGKTNLMQAIMLLSRLFREAGPAYHNISRPTVSARLLAHFRFGEQTSGVSSSVAAITDDSNNDLVVDAQQRWTLRGPKRKPEQFYLPSLRVGQRGWRGYYYGSLAGLGHRPYMTDSYMSRLFPSSAAYRSFLRVAGFCQSMQYYSASQFTNPGTCPVSFEIEREEEENRPTRLHGHAWTLYRIYVAYKAADQVPYQRFIDLVGRNGLRLVDGIRFREYRTSLVEREVTVGGRISARRRERLLVVPQFESAGQLLSPNQLSEGTFKTLALLFNILTDDSSALLVEEPEVCVHHGLLSSIMELIKLYSKRKQMFVSTHSDYVLDQVQPENVFVVNFDRRAGTLVRAISQSMSTQDYRALRRFLSEEGNLGEYWRAAGFEGEDAGGRDHRRGR